MNFCEVQIRQPSALQTSVRLNRAIIRFALLIVELLLSYLLPFLLILITVHLDSIPNLFTEGQLKDKTVDFPFSQKWSLTAIKPIFALPELSVYYLYITS